MPTLAKLPSNNIAEIDAIVDSVVADPSRAAHAKTLLRSKIAQPANIKGFPKQVDPAMDDDDMWDNVPV